MPTLKDISKVFGVSPMTVSNAINGRKGVASDKAEQIRRYAGQMGYQPAYMAKSLVCGSTKTIGLCLRDSVEDPWIGGLVSRIQRRLRDHQLHLNLVHADRSVDEERWALRFFAEFRVEAVLVGPLGYVDEYAAISRSLERLPYAVAFDAIDPLPIDHVRVDEYRGAEMAVEYLISQGHRHIGHLASHLTDIHSPGLGTRCAGFRDTMRRHGLPVDPAWMIQQDAPNQLPRQKLAALLSSKDPKPTAWFCQNDCVAALLIRLLAHRGIHVPKDISVVGFDNQFVAGLVTPGLTTIGYDRNEYADQIVELLLEQLNTKTDRNGQGNGRRRQIRRRELAPKLIVRESVQPWPADPEQPHSGV